MPSAGINSAKPSNLINIFSFKSFPKSFIACWGSSNALINASPKSAKTSNKLFIIEPITPINLANLFCPASLLVNACCKARTAINKAPIPEAITATLRLLKDFITPVIFPFNAPNLPIAPPLIVFKLSCVFFASLPVSLIELFNWSTSLTAALVSTFILYVTSFIF